MVGRHEPFKNVSSYSITNLGFHITALGDCSGEEAETVIRFNEARREYERFFIKDGVMRGAVLINRFQDKPHLVKLIENRTNIESYQDKLRDFAFDIHELPII